MVYYLTFRVRGRIVQKIVLPCKIAIIISVIRPVKGSGYRVPCPKGTVSEFL